MRFTTRPEEVAVTGEEPLFKREAKEVAMVVDVEVCP